MNWPLRDLFLAHVERMREAARAQYRADLLIWAVLAPHQKKPGKPPSIPPILK